MRDLNLMFQSKASHLGARFVNKSKFTINYNQTQADHSTDEATDGIGLVSSCDSPGLVINLQ